MKISKISLENFKGIKELQLDLNCKSTVFFGINGVGKTSILDAVNLIFSNIVNKIVSNRYKQSLSLNMSDITFGANANKVVVDFKFNDDTVISCQSGIDAKTQKKYQNNINEVCKKFDDYYLPSDREKSNQAIPILVNYGVHRLVIDVSLKAKDMQNFDNMSAFDSAIESKIDFKTFFEWFRYEEDLENQVKVSSKNLDYIDSSLQCVRKAITTMLGNVDNLRVQRNPLALMVDKNGISLHVEQLSDGEKCTLALIGDLARRAALANPCVDNPLNGEGIILIDELELHMHTQWQRRILPVLNQLFPNMQFIITTHSPQILGELDEQYNIFALSKNDGQLNCTKINSLMAWDSNLILEELMGTDSLNASVKTQISQMFMLIEKKDFIAARNLADAIDSKLNYPNPDTIKARVLIARGQRLERKL